ncbi:GNAT family N-acetyltransferase [Ensifer sp. 22521]|uniref:GNAT family N-acetyltransferase n=1 Tax=Ensifer sp. 22521 TaxID=3453935 RepID=UPI003F828D8B
MAQHLYPRWINAFFADYTLAQFTASRFEEILAQEDEAIWVSQNAVGIDGFLRMSSNSRAPVDIVSDLEIVTLYVQPRHHGRGIGRKLLKTGLQYCSDIGRASTWLAVNAENEKATAFYIASGFEKVGETHFRIGDRAYPNNILHFRLNRSVADNA